MRFTIEIPDDLAERLHSATGTVPRRALEALAAEGYRSGELTKPDLRRLLGLNTSHEIDGFLKAYNVYEPYGVEDFERERAALKELGL